jgi:hypothetical protein
MLQVILGEVDLKLEITLLFPLLLLLGSLLATVDVALQRLASGFCVLERSASVFLQ